MTRLRVLTRFVIFASVFVALTHPGDVGAADQQAVAGPKPPKESAPDPIRPHGFSVVLVLGDLQAAAGEDDVPPAARKGLADMKDFLPYKSYKLLDAAWILCCGGGRTVNRLRGPEDREYELEIVASSSGKSDSRTYVQFVLKDATGADVEEALVASLATAEARGSQEQELLARQMRDLATKHGELMQKHSREHPDVKRVERDMQELRSKMTSRSAQRSFHARATKTPIINTSFTMDVGETVVVGTSRLKGNSKALIALLTAVPPRGARAAR